MDVPSPMVACLRRDTVGRQHLEGHIPPPPACFYKNVLSGHSHADPLPCSPAATTWSSVAVTETPWPTGPKMVAASLSQSTAGDPGPGRWVSVGRAQAGKTVSVSSRGVSRHLLCCVMFVCRLGGRRWQREGPQALDCCSKIHSYVRAPPLVRASVGGSLGPGPAWRGHGPVCRLEKNKGGSRQLGHGGERDFTPSSLLQTKTPRKCRSGAVTERRRRTCISVLASSTTCDVGK